MQYEHPVACPYCGQMQIVTTNQEEETQEMLNQKAILHCKCPESEVYKGMRETEYAIREMLGEGGKYFDKAIPDDEIGAVRRMCEMILRDEIEAVTASLCCGDVIKLARKGNAVKIRRTSKRQMEL